MESYEDIYKTIKLLSSMLQNPSDIDFRENANTNLNFFNRNFTESYYDARKNLDKDDLLTTYIDVSCSPTTSFSDCEEEMYTISRLPECNEFDLSDHEDLSNAIDELSNSSFMSAISDATVSYAPSMYNEVRPSLKSESSENDECNDDRPKLNRLKRRTPSSGHVIKTKKRKTRSNLLKPGSQLYQFILQLLDDEEKREYIQWVQKKVGIFRIIKKEEVAQMWGKVKKRPMTYDSLSRGLRHYYQQGLLNSVNKKLHYQFTMRALEEWEVIRNLDSIEDTTH